MSVTPPPVPRGMHSLQGLACQGRGGCKIGQGRSLLHQKCQIIVPLLLILNRRPQSSQCISGAGGGVHTGKNDVLESWRMLVLCRRPQLPSIPQLVS